MEAYVDDMLVKSEEAITHERDLEETFSTIRRYKMRFNPTKCVSGVRAGKFLSHMVTERGIKVNSLKVRTIQEM